MIKNKARELFEQAERKKTAEEQDLKSKER